jgi:hypothetical protein
MELALPAFTYPAGFNPAGIGFASFLEHDKTRKQAIEERLVQLGAEATLLRQSGEPVGQGEITSHVKAVSSNAVETFKLKAELSTILHYANEARHKRTASSQCDPHCVPAVPPIETLGLRIDQVGRYRLTKEFVTIGEKEARFLPEGTEFSVTEVAPNDCVVFSPELGDWHYWEIPAVLVDVATPGS